MSLEIAILVFVSTQGTSKETIATLLEKARELVPVVKSQPKPTINKPATTKPTSSKLQKPSAPVRTSNGSSSSEKENVQENSTAETAASREGMPKSKLEKSGIPVSSALSSLTYYY